MPVSAWIAGGMLVPGFTSVDHSEATSPPSISTTAISVTRSQAGWVPVVSRSTIASGASKSGFIAGGAGGYISSTCNLPQNGVELPDCEAEDAQAGDEIDG